MLELMGTVRLLITGPTALLKEKGPGDTPTWANIKALSKATAAEKWHR
jgi:hypothetical protein